MRKPDSEFEIITVFCRKEQKASIEKRKDELEKSRRWFGLYFHFDDRDTAPIYVTPDRKIYESLSGAIKHMSGKYKWDKYL